MNNENLSISYIKGIKKYYCHDLSTFDKEYLVEALIQCLEKVNLLEDQIETLIIANDLYRSQEDKYKKLEADANYFNDR